MNKKAQTENPREKWWEFGGEITNSIFFTICIPIQLWYDMEKTKMEITLHAEREFESLGV